MPTHWSWQLLHGNIGPVISVHGFMGCDAV